MGVRHIKEVRMLRQQGLPIRDICRKTSISRNTVRNILRGQKAKFTYQREESTQPTQEPIKALIESWLKHDSLETKKYRRTAKRMYNVLRAAPYNGAKIPLASAIGGQAVVYPFFNNALTRR